MKLSILSAFIITFSVQATTFIPVPLKKMVQSSNAFVEGEVLFSRSEKDETNQLVTVTTLQLSRWQGVAPKNELVEIFSPGGSLDEEVLFVDGAPKFKEGEKVFLFLREYQDKFWVNSLSLGVYRLKKLGVQEIYVNSVFPYHHEIGQVPPKKFHDLVAKEKKEKFVEKRKDKYELSRERAIAKKSQTGREISSESKTTDESKIPFYWLVGIFATLGVMWNLKRMRK